MPIKSTPPQTYLTAKQVAAKLGTTTKAVYLQVQRDLLPHRRLGRRVLFCEAELEQFLADLPGCSVNRALALREMQQEGSR